MTTNEIREFAEHIFKIHPKIEHLGLIDLEGYVVLDQSSKASSPNDPQTKTEYYFIIK